jgi:hypothetical protein
VPTFGADPEKDSGWVEYAPSTRYVSRPVRDLTNHFSYNKYVSINQRINDDDKIILYTFFSRQLKRGVPFDSLRQLIDKFYQTPAGQSQAPAQVFVSKKVQSELVSDAEVTLEDPVMQWLASGMADTDVTFEHPAVLRKLLLLHCDEALLRYPDCVAQILTRYRQDISMVERLDALESIIKFNIGELDFDPRPALASLVSIDLPTELRTPRRAPAGMRPRQTSVKQAVWAVTR